MKSLFEKGSFAAYGTLQQFISEPNEV